MSDKEKEEKQGEAVNETEQDAVNAASGQEAPNQENAAAEPEAPAQEEKTEAAQETAGTASEEKTEAKKEKTKKPKENTGGIGAAVLVSLLFGLTVFFFAPGEMYLANPVEYQLGPRYILLPMLVAAADAALVVYVFLLFCSVVHRTLFQIFKNLFFGVTAACWVQMTFLNGRMAQFTGDKTEYRADDPFFVADLVIFIVVSALPLCIYIIKRIACRKKDHIPDTHKIVPALCALMAVMQLAGILPNLINILTNDLLTGDPKQVYQSYEPLMQLNPENNVVVFLTDRLDGYWLDTMLERYEDLPVMLDGFTYYKNNISRYTNTFPMVPEMLSGCVYQGESFGNYVRKVWGENQLLPKLHENDWKVNLILDGPSTYLHLLSLQEQSDNIVGKSTGYTINYLKEDGIVPVQARFAGVKVLPYLLKGLVGNDFDSDFSNNFVEWKEDESPDDAHPKSVGVDSDVKCLTYLHNHDVTADSEKKVFNYIHLSCAHEPDKQLARFYFNYQNDQRSDKYATAMGEMTAIWEYCKKMKEAGVYDSSTIIILGDHGRAPSLDEEDDKGLYSEILTSLLVKPAGAKRGHLIIDEETPMSNGYFAPSILEYAGIDHSELGISYNDAVANPPKGSRSLYFYEFMGYYRAPRLLVEYKVYGDAREFANWRE